MRLNQLSILVTELPCQGVENCSKNLLHTHLWAAPNLSWALTALTLVFRHRYYKVEPYVRGLLFTNERKLDITC